MATLATLRSSVQNKLGLDTTASSTEETLVDRWINEGVVDVLVRTRVHVNCLDVDLIANTWKYNLDTDILAILDITVTDSGTGDTLMPQRTTAEDILWKRSRGGDDATSPMLYYALAGNDLLLVYPTPAAGDSLDVFYVPRPTALSISSQDPSTDTLGGIPTEYHKAIELYACWQAAEYTDHQPSRYGLKFQQDYEAWLVRIRKQARNKGGRYLGAARLGRRVRVPRSPSADVGAW